MLTNMLKKAVSGTVVVIALALALSFAFLAPAPAEAASCSSSSSSGSGGGFAACYGGSVKSINVADNSFVIRTIVGFDFVNFRIIVGDLVVRVNSNTAFSGVSGLSGLSVGNSVTVNTTLQLGPGTVVASSVTKN
jgi:hypothetical protein